MTIAAAHAAALHQYIDALLQDGAASAATDARAETPVATWQLCRLGRLQVLLPSAALGSTIDATSVAARPPTWHLAQVEIDGKVCRVAELAQCIAPGLNVPAGDTLVAVAGSAWLLALPAKPEPLALADDAIEWRAQRSSRPWLSGMSRDGRYMALDVHALLASLVTGTGIPA